MPPVKLSWLPQAASRYRWWPPGKAARHPKCRQSDK